MLSLSFRFVAQVKQFDDAFYDALEKKLQILHTFERRCLETLFLARERKQEEEKQNDRDAVRGGEEGEGEGGGKHLPSSSSSLKVVRGFHLKSNNVSSPKRFLSDTFYFCSTQLSTFFFTSKETVMVLDHDARAVRAHHLNLARLPLVFTSSSSSRSRREKNTNRSLTKRYNFQRLFVQ